MPRGWWKIGENTGLNPSLLKSNMTIGTVRMYIPEISKGDGGDRARGTWGRASSGELMYRRKGSGHSLRMRWEKAAEGILRRWYRGLLTLCLLHLLYSEAFGVCFLFLYNFLQSLFLPVSNKMDPLTCEMDVWKYKALGIGCLGSVLQCFGQVCVTIPPCFGKARLGFSQSHPEHFFTLISHDAKVSLLHHLGCTALSFHSLCWFSPSKHLCHVIFFTVQTTKLFLA